MDKDLLLEIAAEIVIAHVSNNTVDPDELPLIINDVFRTLEALSVGGAKTASLSVVQGGLRPAVPIEDSVQPDYIVCLEDGKKLKMLKRYLKTTFGMTPQEYIAKWNLPKDYPLVAPNYAKKRSQLAKKIGLGKGTDVRRGRKPKAATAQAAATTATEKPVKATKKKAAKGKVGRPKKAANPVGRPKKAGKVGRPKKAKA